MDGRKEMQVKHDLRQFHSVHLADITTAIMVKMGSSAAAVTALLNTVINLLSSELYVIVFSLDFSKAFDTIRHSSLQLAFLTISTTGWLTSSTTTPTTPYFN